MPERTPEQEADDAAAYFKRLLEQGIDESRAAQLASAWILGRLRTQEPKADWE